MKKNVLDYLDEIVKKVPDKIAFANESEGYTFSQVYEMVNKVGTFFAQNGYYKKPVAVLMEKHPKTIMAFWGVIRAGCFYVPIDAKMPKSRIRLILENCKPEWLICDEHTKSLAEEIREESGVRVCEFREVIEHVDSFRILLNDKQNHSGKDNTRNADNTSKSDNTRNADNMCNTENMCLHTDLEEIRKKALDTDPIYIVFTSGSTGVPKGVVANHRSVIDYVEGLSKALEFDENTIFANQSPLYFDACFKEIYPTIKFGATTYFVPETLFMFPTKLIEFLNEKKVNTICWVASALTIVSSLGTFEKIKPKCLRTIAFGSEVFPVKQLNLWQQAAPNATFFNLYGPTEATGMSCYYKVDRNFSDEETIPIGKPFENTSVLLLDENNQESNEGEICIRGTCVTMGYYNNPEKTKEVFVQNPLNTMYPEIIYRTGDIGKYNENGELVFVSRKDYQIKHMGHRIELGEIEANVNAISGVKMSACVYVDEKIVLFYAGSLDAKNVLMQLKDKLPRYMIPNNVEQVDTLPFTENGKVNRRELMRMWIESKVN